MSGHVSGVRSRSKAATAVKAATASPVVGSRYHVLLVYELDAVN